MAVQVMASSRNLLQATAKPTPASMNPLLLASSFFGSWRALSSLLDREDDAAVPTQVAFLDELLALDNTSKGMAMATAPQQAYCSAASTTPSQLLEGVTVEGDTALHVVATYGDGDNYLRSADVIYGKAKQLLYELNSNGDTPLHCAARAGKSQMVLHLIALARSGGDDDDDSAGEMIRLKELVRKENGCKETALHEAVRIGSNHIVELLMAADSELACFPREGTSPLYLAILLQQVDIAQTLYDKSGAYLSYSGPDGQNALHAAALRSQVTTKMLLGWNVGLTAQRDQNGSTPLHFATSMLHPRGVHFWIFRPWFAWIRGVWHSTMPFYPVVQVIFHPWFPWNRGVVWHSGTPFDPVLQANEAPMYQADDKGLFPIHIAASAGVNKAVVRFLDKCPNIAGVRDIKGRTFLDVAIVKKKWNIVALACQTPSLSWILNMQDNDGNTALHLCVELGYPDIFGLLLENQQVQLNLTNNKRETPLDLSQSKIRAGNFCSWNPRFMINAALQYCHAKHGNRRLDHFEEEYIRPEDEEKESKKLTEATQTMGLGAVLMATAAFSATFTLPGGYKSDGKPTLSGRYVFDAFIAANSLAFGCSGLATVNLMYSGTEIFDVPARSMHFDVAVFFALCSVTSLATAFVLGLYLMLAPVAHMTATAVCVLASFISLCGYIDPMRGLAVGRALLVRMGSPALVIFARILFLQTATVFWPLIASFIWAEISTRYHHK